MRPLLFARMPVMSLSSLGQACTDAFREAGLCLLLALRSSLHPTLLLGSAGLCILLSSLWLWLFYHYFELIAQLAGVVATFVVLGAGTLGLLPGLASSGPATLSGMAGIAPAMALAALYAAALALLILIALYAGAVLVSIRLLLPWLLLPRARRRALRHYPQLHGRRKQSGHPLRTGQYYLAPWLGLGAGTLLCLLVPLLNGVLLLVLLGYLNLRFLLPYTLHDLASAAEQLQVARLQRGALIVYGVLMLCLVLLPLVNLLLPALLASGSSHLAYRGLQRLDASTGASQAAQVSLSAA